MLLALHHQQHQGGIQELSLDSGILLELDAHHRIDPCFHRTLLSLFVLKLADPQHLATGVEEAALGTVELVDDAGRSISVFAAKRVPP